MENNNSNYLKVSNDSNHLKNSNDFKDLKESIPNTAFLDQLLGAATVFLVTFSAAKLSGRRRGRRQRQIKDVLEMMLTINIIFNTSISLK